MTDDSVVEFLIRAKFPGSNAPPPPETNAADHERWRQRQNEIDAYRRRLAGKSLQQLAELAVRELARPPRQSSDTLWFERPDVAADLDFWSKCPYWSIEEAIALSYGKNPERVSWDTIKSCVQISTFVQEYGRRRELATRAVISKLLFDPVLPGFFLAWARRNDIVPPPELQRRIEARGVVVADWKDLFDKAIRDKNTLAEGYRIAAEQRDALKARVQELEQQVRTESEHQVPDKKLEPGERKTLDTLGAYFARRFDYDPKRPRNTATSRVQAELERYGTTLYEQTIRDLMRDGCARFPDEREKT